jgi:hypothetical protein
MDSKMALSGKADDPAGGKEVATPNSEHVPESSRPVDAFEAALADVIAFERDFQKRKECRGEYAGYPCLHVGNLRKYEEQRQQLHARLRAARYPTVTDEALEKLLDELDSGITAWQGSDYWVAEMLNKLRTFYAAAQLEIERCRAGWKDAERAARPPDVQPVDGKCGIRAAVERAASCAPDWMDEKIDAALSGKEGGDDG